jgi:hypothetical protein
MSLVIVSCTVADFVESAWLVAVTFTVVEEGRSAGAVYTPFVAIVPVDGFPPGMPLTLQLTFVLGVFVTVAENDCELPNKTDPFIGATVTPMAGGGGGGRDVTGLVPPPPQPSSHVPAAITMRSCKAASVVHSRVSRPSIRFALTAFCVRGRMQGGLQAKGQRKA